MSKDIAWLSERESDDPGRLRTDEDRDPEFTPLCDYCGGPIRYPVSLAGVGLTCSRACLGKLERQYSEALKGRRG